MEIIIDDKIHTGLFNQFSPFVKFFPLPLAWDIIPHGFNLYYYKKNYDYTIYISDKKIKLEDLDNAIGYLSFSINNDEPKKPVIYIIFIKSNIPAIGIAHYLMLCVGHIAKTFNISIIYLDDGSDNAHEPNNLYLKVGCKYKNEYPDSNEQEMECSPDTIISKFSAFYQKYVQNGLLSTESFYFYKFKQVLPTGYKLYEYISTNSSTDSSTKLVYISNKELSREQKENYKTHINDESIVKAYVLYGIMKSDNSLKIITLKSNIKRIGLGHYLMIYLGFYCKFNNIEDIIFDDCSFIPGYYENIGCSYDEEGDNCMTCIPDTIISKFPEFYKKFVKSGRLIITPNIRNPQVNFSTDKKTGISSPIRKTETKRRTRSRK